MQSQEREGHDDAVLSVKERLAAYKLQKEKEKALKKVSSIKSSNKKPSVSSQRVTSTRPTTCPARVKKTNSTTIKEKPKINIQTQYQIQKTIYLQMKMAHFIMINAFEAQQAQATEMLGKMWNYVISQLKAQGDSDLETLRQEQQLELQDAVSTIHAPVTNLQSELRCFRHNLESLHNALERASVSAYINVTNDEDVHELQQGMKSLKTAVNRCTSALDKSNFEARLSEISNYQQKTRDVERCLHSDLAKSLKTFQKLQHSMDKEASEVIHRLQKRMISTP